MAKVYLLTAGSYSDYYIAGAFSTRELAEAARAEMAKTLGKDEGDVEEYELDELVGLAYRESWTASIRREDGEVYAYPGRGTWRFGHPTAVAVVDLDDHISVDSPISSEHAVNVATEKRQEWLRSRAITPTAAGS